MSEPASLAWFARHEARLAWRDWLSLMTAGRRRRVRTVVMGFLAAAVLLHGLALLTLRGVEPLTGAPDRHLLASIAATLLASFSLMLSQAMESVTRAFHARGDLDLILTSPVAASRLFAVRIAAMAASIMGMSLVLGAPFIDIAVWYGGARWLGGYVAAAAMAMLAVALATAIVGLLFRVAGPRRTRAIAQIVAAVTGAAFAIALQFAAILSYGSESGMSAPRFEVLERFGPDPDSALWWPAHAAIGDPWALAGLLAAGLAALAVAIHVHAPRFGALVLATVDAPPGPDRIARRNTGFRDGSPARSLRRKEWALLLRDPWLMSQTLMQLLYLLPGVFVLWRGFGGGGQAPALLVPVLILAAGQLGGGLAWLAVSGEDAPDLIATAPVTAARVFRARTEAILGAIAAIFGPLAALLAFSQPVAALTAFGGALVAAGSATAIQYWFRTQSRRGLFRRRQTSSRIATFAEAVSSTLWAGTGALLAAGSVLALLSGALVLVIVAGVWLVSPARTAASA